MNYNTRKLLRLLKKVGYTKVEIGYKQSKKMPYDYGIKCYPDINLGPKLDYGDGKPLKRETTWPALWYILRKIPKGDWGCGSGHAHQIRHNVFDEGVYDLTTLTF
jgi:hypothetical protein